MSDKMPPCPKCGSVKIYSRGRYEASAYISYDDDGKMSDHIVISDGRLIPSNVVYCGNCGEVRTNLLIDDRKAVSANKPVIRRLWKTK